MAVEVFSKCLGLRCGLLSLRVGFNNSSGNFDRSNELSNRQAGLGCIDQVTAV